MNSTVFITNKSSTHDYSSASYFGALRFVTSGNYPIFKTTRLQEEIIDALVYSTEDDFLLFSGSSTVAALCQLVWFEMHKSAKILMWDRTQTKYVQRVIVKADIRVAIETTRDQLKTQGR